MAADHVTASGRVNRIDAVTASARKPIDIERLLQWAIGAEHADRVIEYVDAETEEERRRAADGLGGHSADGLWACERYGRLGTFIDCSGSSGGYASAQIHHDAELVYRTAKAGLQWQVLRDVIHHAKAGTQPNHTPCQPWAFHPELAMKRNGWKVRVRKMPNGARFCPIKLVDHRRELDNARWLWRSWWTALKTLEAALLDDPDQLQRWDLVPWKVPNEPWRLDKSC